MRDLIADRLRDDGSRIAGAMTYLLDSSALLAFYYGEPGAMRVREILSDQRVAVHLSVISLAEFWIRLHVEGWGHVFDDQWARVMDLVNGLYPVSEAVTRPGN